nr:head-tail connector protein [uncultured Bacteroides sp.]
MYINLNIAKQHLNIDSSYTEEDSYIQQLIDVAEDVVCQSINSDTLLLITNATGETINQIPKSLQQATLLMVGQFYANREPVAFASVNKVPLAFDYLISLYRKY